jgi:hypothetical protein
MSETLKKKSSAVAVTSVLLIGVGAASAYWTMGGAGSGSATTGSGQSLTVNQTSVVTGLGPGVAPAELSGDFDNPNKDFVRVASVTAKLASVTPVKETDTCGVGDYTIINENMTVDANVPAGNGEGEWRGALLSFVNDPARDQNGCKGATVTIDYTINY